MFKSISLRGVFRSLPIVSLLLVACTITPPLPFIPSPETPQWLQHKQAVQQISRYKARGSLLYTAGYKKVYARFFLQQYSPQHYRLLLLNPLGSTELDLQVDSGVIQIVDSRGQRHTRDDPQETIRLLTGMSLPLDDIRMWILGLPGESKQFQLSTDNRLRQAVLQADKQQWNVQYSSYDLQVNPPLPDRIELSHEDLSIKLKIDNWDLQ